MSEQLLTQQLESPSETGRVEPRFTQPGVSSVVCVSDFAAGRAIAYSNCLAFMSARYAENCELVATAHRDLRDRFEHAVFQCTRSNR